MEHPDIFTSYLRLSQHMSQLFRAHFGRLDLTFPQALVLTALGDGDPVPISTLAERTGSANSTVSGIVDRLEKLGLAKRERSIRIHDLRACTTPQALLGKLAFLAGLQSAPVPQTLPALLERFSWSRVPRQDIRVPEGLFTLSECSPD